MSTLVFTYWVVIAIAFTSNGPIKTVKGEDLTQEQCYYAVDKLRKQGIESYCVPQETKQRYVFSR